MVVLAFSGTTMNCFLKDAFQYIVLGFRAPPRVLGAFPNDSGPKPQITLGLLTLDGVRQWLSSMMASKTGPRHLNHRTSVFLLQALTEQKV
jgi:hypothetical protein